MSRFEYIRLADAVAADIAGGALKPGDRLPPQRAFAYERKIAASTASRVYTELLRRGLVVGEVGRGTFVSGESRHPIATLPHEPRAVRIDLEINYPMLPTQAAMIAKSLAGLERAEALDIAQRQGSSGGTQAARNIASGFMARPGWTPNSEQFAFTANGRQCIAALSALVPAGGRCGVEALTYPFIKGIAARLGITLVPLAMDAQGVRPDSVQKAHREGQLSALYIQPTIQNPLGMTMPAARRADLMRVVEKLDLTVIEDSVYGFLSDEAPMAAMAPDRCVVLDSLSKKVAPGLALGFIVAPPRLRENILNSIRSGGWTASGYAFAAGQRLMGDGTATELIRLKRADAQRRQQMAAERLAGFEIQADRKSYHLWLSLPQHWRSQSFVAAAARRDIALTPSTTFCITPGHAPNAVRLALAAPAIEQLDFALRTLADILRTQQDDFDSTE
jgi:DNA-binding transcriptional MocR family regulator